MLKKLIILLSFCLCLASFAEELKTVIANGRADVQGKHARERALADALREAVRQGAGVDIVSETKVQNFELEYDKVMTRSLGYIKSYKILKQGKMDVFYEVEIQATVGKGTPGIDNVLALRNLISRKRSPRIIAITARPNISGIELNSNAIKGTVEELAVKIGLDLRSEEGAAEVLRKKLLRAEFSGDTEAEKALLKDLSSKCDFYMQTAVEGSYLGRKNIAGKERHKFSIAFDLIAYRSDDHSRFARLRVPALEYYSLKENKEAAFEEIVFKIFYEKFPTEGKLAQLKDRSLIALVQNILTTWMTELDLGRKYQLSFMKMNNKTYRSLVQQLNKKEEINWVNGYEYDRQTESFIAVETKLSLGDFSDMVSGLISDEWELDRQTPRSLQFIRTRNGGIPLVESRTPIWVWGIGALLLIVIILLASLVLKKKE